jgi:RND family efflux transporter MFP subunit
MQKRFIPIAAAALLAAACGHSRTEPPAESASPTVSAPTVTVVRADLAEPFEAGGVVRAKTTAAVTSRIMAPVEQVLVAAGDRVRAGQLLARLDARDLGAQQRRASSGREAAEQGSKASSSERDAARASLALAKATHARVAALHERKSATDGELDQAVAQLREAEARVAGADARVAEAAAGLAAAAAGADAAGVSASWALITAPFDGVVTEKLVEPGNMAAPGQPLFRLEQQGGLRLEVRVDESRAGFVKVGRDVDVIVDAPGLDGATTLAATGRVAEMARDASAGAHAFLVKIDLPRDLAVPSSTYARARFAGPARSTIAVPKAAVVRSGQLASVFAVEGDRARLRLVSLGVERGDTVEIVAGLAAGDRIVSQVVPALADGVRIGGAR